MPKRNIALWFLGALVALAMGVTAVQANHNQFTNSVKPPNITVTAAPNPADESVTITVQGQLSSDIEECDVERTKFNYVGGGPSAILGSGVLIASGPFQGLYIPINITPSVDGSCQPTGPVGGVPATFRGSRTFNTATLAEAQYDFSVFIKDVYEETGINFGSFTVEHPDPVEEPTTNAPVCAPKTQSVTPGATVSLTATKGNGTFSWSAPNADQGFRNGSGTSFNTKFSTTGTKTVTVTSNGKTDNCTVIVSEAACAPVTVRVSSKTTSGAPHPTTWVIGNPTGSWLYSPNYASPAATGEYSNLPKGNYTVIAQQEVGGKKLKSAEPARLAQCGDTLNFNLVYEDITTVPPPPTTHLACQNNSCVRVAGAGSDQCSPEGSTCGPNDPPPPPPGASLTVYPSYSSVQAGGSTGFEAIYDPDGSGPQAQQEVTKLAAWSASPAQIASFQGSGTGIAVYRGMQQGEATITASYAALSDTAILGVSVSPPKALTVKLTASPSSGETPHTTVLAASVGGEATGTINYTFWKHCNYTGVSIPQAVAQCGNWDGKFDGINTNPKGLTVVYNSAGSKIPKVIVEREGLAASDWDTVNVTGAPVTHLACRNNSCVKVEGSGSNQCSPEGSSCGAAETHSECRMNSCVKVNGPGADRCRVSADCADGPPPQPTHGVCDRVQMACVNVAGPGPSDCSSDSGCGISTPTHLECQNQSCVLVGGAGTNSAGCNMIGDTCNADPGPVGPASCTFTASPQLVPKGATSRLSWSCVNVTLCSVTNSATGAVLEPNGSPSDQVDTPALATTTTFSLNCQSNPFTGSVTVRVLSINETPPR